MLEVGTENERIIPRTQCQEVCPLAKCFADSDSEGEYSPSDNDAQSCGDSESAGESLRSGRCTGGTTNRTTFRL